MKPILYCILLSSASLACQSPNSRGSAPSDTLSNIVGSDRDPSGCIASAGYTWSELKQECVRPWEEGVQLRAVHTAGSAQMSAYLLFDQDRKNVEIFMAENNLVLPQVSAETYSTQNFSVEKDSVGWAVRFNDRTIYKEDAEIQ